MSSKGDDSKASPLLETDALRAVLEAFPAAAIAADPEGRIRVANAAAERLFGGMPGSLLSLELEALIPEHLGPRHRALRAEFQRVPAQRAMAPGRELVARRLDGDEVAVEISLSPIRTPAGPLVLASVIDVGERKRLEQYATARLRESEETFSKSFAACPHPIGITELASGLLVEINGSFEQTFGYSREEALGKTTNELGIWANPEDRGRFVALMTKHGSVRELEVISRNRRGDLLVTRLSAEQVILGGVPHVVTFVRDATDQARVELALRESEEKFALAFRASPYAMSLLDSAEARFVEVNEHFERLFGIGRDAALGHTSLELGLWTRPEDREEFAFLLDTEGRVRDFPATMRTEVGEERSCLLSAERIEIGAKAYIVSIARDVTDQRLIERAKTELETQLRQTQKLEALGTLAGGIAHDFNNILGAIVAYTDLIGFDVESPTDVDKHVVELRRATNRARELVAQILTFSRRQKPERKAVRLEGAVREALKLLRSTLPATIQIETHIDETTPVVLADPSQVHQVVMNLCTNAAHAMEGMQGRLTIVLESFRSGTSSRVNSEVFPGRYARLSIADTGAGMDPATQGRIFEPFFTTKRPGEGTGLGLAVVHGIVKEHEGHIGVESNPGTGTTFELLFPEFTSEEPVIEETSTGLPRGSGQTVLLVDDEQRLCDSLSQLLERLGYRVTARSHPIEALEEFSRSPTRFDVVLTDLTMPDMTGADLTRAILEIRPQARVLIMSGFSGPLTADALKAIGATEFIQKPVMARMLAKTLHGVLSNRAALRSAG